MSSAGVILGEETDEIYKERLVDFENVPAQILRVIHAIFFLMSTQTETVIAVEQPAEGQAQAQAQYPREPLQLKGALDQYKSFDVTPVIGREFVDVNLKDWLRAPNSDELIRDLAITSEISLLP